MVAGGFFTIVQAAETAAELHGPPAAARGFHCRLKTDFINAGLLQMSLKTSAWDVHAACVPAKSLQSCSFVRSWVPWFLFGFPFCSVPESQRNRVKERTRTVSPSILPSPLGLRWSCLQHLFALAGRFFTTEPPGKLMQTIHRRLIILQ